MSNTQKRKRYNGKKHKTQRKSISAVMEQKKQNRRRNKMIRNIRMGRIYRGGDNQMVGGGGGGFVSQFIGKPWTPDSLGRNYFALSPKGVGPGIIPTFDNRQALGSARYPTQLGPQLAKLGQVGGSTFNRKSRKSARGGGFVSDFYDNAKYSLDKLTSTMEGTSPPANPNPYVQPISKNIL
jgi:hypothetical protein